MEAVFLLFIFFIGILLLTGIRIIRTQQVAIVEFLGRFNRILKPGFNVIIPILENVRVRVDLRTQSLKMHVNSISKDNVKIRIGIDVLYFVKNNGDAIFKSYYSLQNPLSGINSIVDNAIRAKINEFEHIEVLSKRNEFSEFLQEILSDKLAEWGFTVDSVQITEIELPETLLAAMNDVKTTERKKEAALNEAEAKKILIVKEAEADQERRRLQGLGFAQEREEVAKGLKKSVEEFKNALGESSNPYEIMNIILMTNYFDALKDIGKNPSSKVIMLDGSPSGVKSLRDQIMAGIHASKG